MDRLTWLNSIHPLPLHEGKNVKHWTQLLNDLFRNGACLIDTFEGGFPGEVHKIFGRLLVVLILRTILELLAGNLIRQGCLLPRVEYADVPRLAREVELRLL